MGDPTTKDESLAELTRHALHDLLHDAGLNHRSQAMGWSLLTQHRDGGPPKKAGSKTVSLMV